MNINHNDPVTWLNALWEVIGDWEEHIRVSYEDVDDVKTVMAWVTEALGYDINHDGDYVETIEE